MKILNYITELTKGLHKKVYIDRDEYRNVALTNKKKVEELEDELYDSELTIDMLQDNITEIEVDTQSELEQYCSNRYKEIKKFAYKDKGLHNKNRFAMYPNELIMPDIYIVEELRKKIGNKLIDIKKWAIKIGNFVDNKYKWTSDLDTDGYIDIYQHIYEAVFSTEQDCDNHAGLVCSIEPEFGIGFGFAGNTGHAFVVFMYQDELWILETNNVYDNNMNTKVFQYNMQSHYKLDIIFTQHKTFECKTTPARFGIKTR